MPDFLGYLSSSESISRILGAGLTVVVGMVGKYFQPAPKVVWGIPHGFTFVGLDANGVKSKLTRTGSVFVQNIGKATATGIEVHLNFEPEQFEIWPSFDFETTKNPEGRFVIRVKNLGYRESFTVEMISSRELPATLRVRSDLGEARAVTLRTTENFPAWKIKVFQALVILGIFAICQNLAALFV